MQTRTTKNENGFSLIELIIAMAITLTIMGLATTLLAASFAARSRENTKSDAIADVQRALNIMTREISNSGLKLPGNVPTVSSNGIVAGDSGEDSIRVVSNLNGMPDSANGYFEDSDVTDSDEDVKFLMYVDNTLGQRYIVRYEKNGTNQTTVLANRIDSLIFRYYDEKVTYTTTTNSDGEADIKTVVNALGNTETEVSPGSAKFVVIAVGVTLPAVGASGSNGYQPQTQITLTSDVVLRNTIVY
jgi:prepilin-type N-terminal cleavage/methylation domain-containing protein